MLWYRVSCVPPYMWMKSVKILLNYCVKETETTTMTNRTQPMYEYLVGKNRRQSKLIDLNCVRASFSWSGYSSFWNASAQIPPLISYVHRQCVCVLRTSVCHLQRIAHEGIRDYFRNLADVLLNFTIWSHGVITVTLYECPSQQHVIWKLC